METRFLHALLMVVETSSIAETARRLNVTPSAVAQRIKALEDEIGFPLIHRSGHSMCPTAAGAAILGDARRIVSAARDIKAIAGGDVGAGGLSIGVITTAATGLLPDILSALKVNQPKIDVYVLPGISVDLYRRVIDGDLDAAILIKPHFSMPKTVDWLPLRHEPLVVLTPRTLTETDPHALLRREPFIRYDRNYWGGRLADLYLRRMRIRPREQYELDSLEAISVLVDRGLGISLVPDWPPPWPEGISIRKITIAGSPMRSIGILWSKTSKRTSLVQTFAKEATAALRLKARS